MYIYKHVKDDKIQNCLYPSMEEAIQAISVEYKNNSTRPIGIYGEDGKSVVLNRNQLLEEFGRLKATG